MWLLVRFEVVDGVVVGVGWVLLGLALCAVSWKIVVGWAGCLAAALGWWGVMVVVAVVCVLAEGVCVVDMVDAAALGCPCTGAGVDEVAADGEVVGECGGAVGAEG